MRYDAGSWILRVGAREEGTIRAERSFSYAEAQSLLHLLSELSEILAFSLS